MNLYTAKKLKPLLRFHGRILEDDESKGLYFNWTCSGFTLCFTGKKLRAQFLAHGDRLPMPVGDESPLDLPCVGLVDEDGENLSCRIKCEEGSHWYDLFDGDQGSHTLRIVKLSENMRGKAALLALETDGEIISVEKPEANLSIEFVGDSITCGFGNEAPGRDDLFKTEEENGWMTYGAIAGRKLNAEFNMISVSGISACKAKHPMFPGHQMDDIYEYTDLYCDERLEKKPREWDFKNNKKDIVVINLGTNDVNPIRFYRDLATADEEETWFSQSYRKFIEKLRRLNGLDSILVFTLGPLDYYLYDNIKKVVDEYKCSSGDKQIYCFKLIGVNLITEGFGAVSHPSLKTHIRMGNELTERLKQIISEHRT